MPMVDRLEIVSRVWILDMFAQFILRDSYVALHLTEITRESFSESK